MNALIIAKKEFKTAFKDKIFIIITLLFIILSVLSVYIGSSTKSALLAAFNDIITSLKSQGITTLPPAPQIFPLAILQNIITYISIIGAVLAIFLGYDTFIGERENGTIKLLLTRPIYRDQLFSGKLLGGGMVIGLLLSVTLLFNIILFSLISGMVPNLSEILRLVIFMLFAFCYMMMFYIATMYVSIKTNDRSYGFLIMLIIWIGVSFVIPQLAESQKAFAYALNSTAQTVTQVPTDTPISQAIQIFSPTVHFKNIGNDLLQVNSQTAQQNIFTIIQSDFAAILYMLIPAFVLLLLSYKSFLKAVV
jgi:ABC-2 type transport system permease protein